MWRLAVAVVMVMGLVGCGGRGAADAPVRTVAPPDASRPSAPRGGGGVLVRLERIDGRFGRHDTLTVTRSGAASMQLAHGGGGFRKQACALGAASVRGLERDLTRLPIDGRTRRVPGYPRIKNIDNVIVARPPVYAVTYRGRVQVFGGERMPVDGAPLAARMERILTAHEGHCVTTFQRP
jgi:hypothetical protein